MKMVAPATKEPCNYTARETGMKKYEHRAKFGENRTRCAAVGPPSALYHTLGWLYAVYRVAWDEFSPPECHPCRFWGVLSGGNKLFMWAARGRNLKTKACKPIQEGSQTRNELRKNEIRMELRH